MKILVVEDEPKIANSVKKGLEQEAFTVDVAYDGTKGFDLASTGDYDVIVLDLMLPGINGIDICRNLRQMAIHTPILVLTARDQTGDKVEGLDAGADDYLTKPFAFEELLARIRALSRRPSGSLPVILTMGGLSLDPVSFTVSRFGRPIHLSAREFALLEYLMRQPGRIISKDRIIDQVWSYETGILPNTVEVYIASLRKKIDLPFPRKPRLIHTVRGFGYQLNL